MTPCPLYPHPLTPTTLYMQTEQNELNTKRLCTRFVNCTVQTNLDWFDPKTPPINLKGEHSVVLCYTKENQEYEVCYWDGANFLRNADDMPTIPDEWAYLPRSTKD